MHSTYCIRFKIPCNIPNVQDTGQPLLYIHTVHICKIQDSLHHTYCIIFRIVYTTSTYCIRFRIAALFFFLRRKICDSLPQTYRMLFIIACAKLLHKVQDNQHFTNCKTLTLTAVGRSAHTILKCLKVQKISKIDLFHGKVLLNLCLGLCTPPKTSFYASGQAKPEK